MTMLLFQLYYNKNIVVFLYPNKRNWRFTSPSSHSEGALTPKAGKGETPLRTKGCLEGESPVGTWRKGQKKMKHHLENKKKGNFSTPISNTSRGWETPVQPSGFVLSWIKYPHSKGENDLECFMDYSGKFSTSLCFSTWRSSTSTFPETLRQFKYQRLKQSIGSEETAAIPRRRRDQTSLIFPHKWNSTILVPPFWTTRFHLWIKPSWEHESHLQPWSSVLHPPIPRHEHIPEGRKHSQKS